MVFVIMPYKLRAAIAAGLRDQSKSGPITHRELAWPGKSMPIAEHEFRGLT